MPRLHKDLWAIFSGVKNKHDNEQLRQVLTPKLEEREGELVDIHLKIRDDFYEALTAFSSCLKVALQSMTFFEDKSFSDLDRKHYKETEKQLSHLRQVIQRDTGKAVDYSQYEAEIQKLRNKHVVGVQVREPAGVYEVSKMGQKEEPEKWAPEKTRNETDIITTRVAKMIEQDLRDDPYAQEAFSKLLRQAIQEAEQLFDYPLKQYLLFHEFEQQVRERRLEDIPSVFKANHNAQAYFGVFKKNLLEIFMVMDEQAQDKWVSLAFEVDRHVKASLAEHSINRQNLENDIRKSLLPLIFSECKTVGLDIKPSKQIVEGIIQIIRVSLDNR